jgi:hypothetical protein
MDVLSHDHHFTQEGFHILFVGLASLGLPSPLASLGACLHVRMLLVW